MQQQRRSPRWLILNPHSRIFTYAFVSILSFLLLFHRLLTARTAHTSMTPNPQVRTSKLLMPNSSVAPLSDSSPLLPAVNTITAPRQANTSTEDAIKVAPYESATPQKLPLQAAFTYVECPQEQVRGYSTVRPEQLKAYEVNIIWCRATQTRYGIQVSKSYGSAPQVARELWTKRSCDDVLTAGKPLSCLERYGA